MELGQADRRSKARAESGGFLEFDFGGVAEGVEDAEEEIGGNVFGVAVHDGGEAGARGTCEARDLSMRQAFALNDFDNFRVEIAAKRDFRSIRRSEAQGFGKLRGVACDGGFRLLHGATPLAAPTSRMSHIWDMVSREGGQSPPRGGGVNASCESRHRAVEQRKMAT